MTEKKKLYPNKKKRTTLKDVANDVGVSVNAVSGVLNTRRVEVRVSDQTRRAILASARKLNYRRNVAASSLAGGRTRTLGILMATLGSPFDGPLAAAFEQEAASLGYQCFVGCTLYGGLNKFDYVDQFLSHGVDGLLLTAFWYEDSMTSALQRALDENIPVIFVDYKWEKYPATLVCSDHRMGGRLIGGHLHEVGHRDIALLQFADEAPIQSIRDRMKGAQEAFEEQGDGARAPQWVVPCAGNVAQYGVYLAKQIKKFPEVTALVCPNDVRAYQVMYDLKQQGIRVPEDVALTGYDDLLAPFSRTVSGMNEDMFQNVLPNPLTTVKQPLREIGIEAARALVEQIDHGSPEVFEDKTLGVELVVRTSSALPERVLLKGKKRV